MDSNLRSDCIRVLQVVNVMDRAGLETMIMNHYRHMDRSVIQFDFLTHRDCDGAYDEEIRDLGGRIFRAPRLFPQNYPNYIRYSNQFYSENSYKIVHSHIDSMSAFPLAMAKRAGVPVRISHSHSSTIEFDYRYPIKQIAKRCLPKVATDFWACGDMAGQFLFAGKPYRVVKNAIDLSVCRYDSAKRLSKRMDLGVSADTLVLCHVGRFSKVKNQRFLVSVAKELQQRGEDFVLLLIGDGEMRQEIEDIARNNGLDTTIRFLGLRQDIGELLQAADMMLFPSLYEGVPLALIEAQCAGLPVIASDNVSAESKLTAEFLFAGLNEQKWADTIVSLKGATRSRADNYSLLESVGYEINGSAAALSAMYVELFKKGCL